MKKIQLFIREEAYKDLESIWLYSFETWSLRKADKYYNDLIEAFEFLCDDPKIGKSAAHLRKGYQSYKVNSYLIFYTTTDFELDVIRIIHSQMDIPNRLID